MTPTFEQGEKENENENSMNWISHLQANGTTDFIIHFCIAMAKVWFGKLFNEIMRQPFGSTDVVKVLSLSIICFQCANLSSNESLGSYVTR